MKIKSLILAMAACVGLFTACTDELDNGSAKNPNETTGNAYMTLTFSNPGGAGTRANAGQEGDGREPGTTEETKISDANIFLFQGGKLAQIVTQTGTDLTSGTDSKVDQTWTTKPFQLAVGTYQVYVVVNETTTRELTSLIIGTTLEAFQAKVFKVALTTGDYCRKDHFLMTNALAADVEGVADVKAENDSEGRAAQVSVTVERAAAKISLAVPDGKTMEVKDAAGTKIADVDFKSYKIINTRNGAFSLRRATAGNNTTNFTEWIVGGPETSSNPTTATNFVLDDLFTQKSDMRGNFDKELYQNNYSRKHNTYVAWRQLGDGGKKQTLAYCLENTMEVNNDVEGLVTTVLFRAVYKPTPTAIKGTLSNEGTFYRYSNGKLYASLDDLVKNEFSSYAAAKEQDAFGLKTASVNIADMAAVATYFATLTQEVLYRQHNTEMYPQGYCYYKYFIRHANNANDTERGVMEHVIVRNNVYNLTILGISGLGSISSGTPGPKDPTNPGPGIDEPTVGTNPEIPGTVDPDGPKEPETPIIPIDPETPTEQSKTYLDVTVNILKWVSRNNEIIL